MPDSQTGPPESIFKHVPRGTLKPFELAAFKHSLHGSTYCTIHVHAPGYKTALRAAFAVYCVNRGWDESTPYSVGPGGRSLVVEQDGETITIVPAQYATAKALKMGYTDTGIVLPRDLRAATAAEVQHAD